MKEIEVWKVVFRQANARYRSVASSAASIYYKQNEWAERPGGCGPLAAFATKFDAYLFALYSCPAVRTAIFKATAVRSRARSLWSKDGKKYQAHSDYLGTVYCDRIKLLERV